VRRTLPATLELIFASLLLATLIGIPLGTLAAVRHNGLLDHVVRVVTVGGLAVASFWFAIMLQLLFSMELEWLPLRGRIGVMSALPPGVNSVLEIVVNGLDRATIDQALRAGIEAACRPGVVEISAGNYGGKLGKHHFQLHALLSGAGS
jgi:ABC-type dipeptide/oligopeptide/nickel transport system permease component